MKKQSCTVRLSTLMTVNRNLWIFTKTHWNNHDVSRNFKLGPDLSFFKKTVKKYKIMIIIIMIIIIIIIIIIK